MGRCGVRYKFTDVLVARAAFISAVEDADLANFRNIDKFFFFTGLYGVTLENGNLEEFYGGRYK